VSEAELPPWLVSGDERPAVIARIWATVDLDRAVADSGLAAETLPDDPHLNAIVRLVRPPGAAAIALVEPSTEGRLAETLARRGEGLIGLYVAAPAALDVVAARAQAAGARLGRIAAGPFGRSALVGGDARGPQIVIVEDRAGTIAR
jgi:hypothetical protein